MNFIMSQLLADPSQERSVTETTANGQQKRTVTVKTKPGKKEQAPEMPLDPTSANLPQGVLDMMGMGQPQPQQQSIPTELMQMMLSGAPSPQPSMDPMAGQMPMTNLYGG